MYMHMGGYIAYYTRYISGLREGPHNLILLHKRCQALA